MTPQEKDLVQKVFDRLANAGAGAKDAEAESFIGELVRRQPDAAYGLTQAVIMLEAGLNQADQKITDLQRQLDQARAGSSASSGGGSSGGFLGGSSPWGNSSVPRSGPQPQPQPEPQQAYYAPPPQAWPPAAPQASPWAQPSGGSSFLRNAATMAAGVAGGTLIAEGLSSMFGHHYGGGYGFGGGGYGGGGFGGGPEIIEERVTVNNNYYDGDRGEGHHQASSDTSGVQDASYDDAGNFDDGSSSFDDGGDYGSDV